MTERKSFWTTLPGIISGIAATVTGLAVLIPLILGAAGKHNPKDAASTTGPPPSVTAGGAVSPTVTTTDTGSSNTATGAAPTDASGTTPSSGASPSGTDTGGSASLLADSSSVNFGSVKGGTTSAARTVTLTNTGTAAATIDSVKLTGSNSGDFSLTSSTCGPATAIPPQGSCQIQVTFSPSTLNASKASVSIGYHPPPGAFTTVTLSGSGSIL